MKQNLDVFDFSLTAEDMESIRPLDMALDVFKRKYGGTEMPDTMKQLLESVIKEAGI